MNFVVVVSVVLAGVATGFPENRVKRNPQNTIVEVIPVEVIEVDPIPSVLAFDFDAARAGKYFSPPIAIGEKAPPKESKAEEKKEVTKRDESATERKQKEEEMKEKEEEKEEEEEDEDELKLDEQIDVRIDDKADETTSKPAKE